MRCSTIEIVDVVRGVTCQEVKEVKHMKSLGTS
jgi:hypothetical protein